VLALEPDDAEQPGIVADVTGMIADRGISIRQTVSEDPEFTDEPRLYVITEQVLPGDLINAIRDLDYVRSIELK
jgi:predicted regulator of amino acid metabolism with ACT domain